MALRRAAEGIVWSSRRNLRDQVEKTLSHPGGLEGRDGTRAERQVCTLLKGLMLEQFLLTPGPEEVGELASYEGTWHLRKTPGPY